LLPQLTEDDLREIDRLYPDPDKVPESIYREDRLDQGLGRMFKRIEAAYAHYAYIAPVRQTAHLASSEVPVYLYHWALRSDVIGGARHGDNMMYEMRDPKTCAKSEAANELSVVIHAYLTSFICTGDPNQPRDQYGDKPLWAKYDVNLPKIMILGKQTDLVTGDVGPPAELEDDVWAKTESDFWWSKVGLA
jgi:carboxylesterase type B